MSTKRKTYTIKEKLGIIDRVTPCESEITTMDTHLVLWSTRATPGISASKN
jgi:hypothetical protein